MPKFVLVRIMTQYLYPDFLRVFENTFRLPKYHYRLKNVFYDWQDDPYQNFMVDILLSLEPRFEPKDKILINENEEWLEVLFFTQGIYLVGFEINRKKYFVLNFNSANNMEAIGAYGCMFNERALFTYKTGS